MPVIRYRAMGFRGPEKEGDGAKPVGRSRPTMKASGSRCRSVASGLAAPVALALLAGCAWAPVHDSPRAALPRPPQLIEYYRYPPVTAPPVIKHSRNRGKFWVHSVELTPPHEGVPAKIAGRAPIHIVWYEPKTSSRVPAVLISPISGSNTLFVDGFAESFALSGYHAIIVKRLPIPFQPRGPISQVEDYMLTVVTRERQALDWLFAQPTVDTNRVASFGISYGAIVNAATAGVDSRLKVNVLALAGAPLPNVLEISAEKNLRRFWSGMCASHRLTDEQLAEQLRASIRTDPYRLAPYIDSGDVLMVIAMFDRSVGTVNSIRLWNALGGPDVAFVPFGHYTTILALPSLEFTATHYIHEKFDPEPPPGNRGWLYGGP